MSQTVRPALRANPFGGVNSASVESAYSAWRDGTLVCPLDPERTPSPLARRAHDSFRAHVLAPGFSCVGAKAAITGNAYRFGFYAGMGTRAANAGVAYDLWEFVRELPTFETDYTTFVASFNGPAARDESEWERALWSQLQGLHDLDQRYHAWDTSVSSDPEDPDFSFSFAETAFFVVGLHPLSSRLARRFEWPTLVFNAHAQFGRLREQNKFERLRETVRARERKLQGSLNPNLSDYGERSEARQYSGRAVEVDWRCPFHARSGRGEGAND